MSAAPSIIPEQVISSPSQSARHFSKPCGSGVEAMSIPYTSVTTLTSGWQSSPNERGTIDILWGSCFTIFLCTWTAICLNIPHPNASKFRIFRTKAQWMFWGIVGPELVLSVAMGQFASARRSVTRFRRMGYAQWTLRHAFFADMGGITLQPRQSTPFPVNSRQLAYLLQHKYITYPTITAEDIWDKSKADTLGKVLTLAQASWLAIQLCGRAIVRLPTTTLELSAGAIVFCTFGTFICWLQKPVDILRGITIRSDASTAQILLDAGEEAAAPYKHTPLDFVAKESFTFSHDVMGFVGMRCDDMDRPLRRFPNDRFPDIATEEKITLFLVTLAYILTGTTLFFWIFETIAARHRFGRWDKYLIWLRLKPAEIAEIDTTKAFKSSHDEPDDRAKFEQEQKSAKPIPLWEVGLILPVILIYAAARAYMVVEMFVNLRALPVGAYQTVSFAQVIPHF